MEKIYLPHVKGNDTIKTALERLKKTDSRAIILSREPELQQLYMNADIVEAFKENLEYCSELPDSKGNPVAILSTETNIEPEQLSFAVNDVQERGSLQQMEDSFSLPEFDLETELDQHGSLYGILKIPEEYEDDINLLVITRHEGVKYSILSAAKVCVCSSSWHHTWNVPPPNSSDKCDYCDNPYNCY